MRYFAALTLAAVLGAFAASALAQQYKWTDKDGRVNYSDKPPIGGSATQIHSRMSSVTGNAAAGSAKGSSAPMSVAEQEQAFRKRQIEGREGAQKQAQADSQNKQKAEACSSARSRVAGLDVGGRQVRFNEKGERSYLDDGQISQERTRAEQDIRQYCG